MKILFETLLLLVLSSATAFGQGLMLPSMEASLEIQETREKLQFSLDSASSLAQIPLHAKFYNHSLTYEDAERLDQDYWWKLPADNFALRAYIMLALHPDDSLIIYSVEGQVIEKLSSEDVLPEYWISKPIMDGAILRYRSHSNKTPVTYIVGYSLKPLTDTKKDALDFGDSQSCEINIACPEGDNFRDVEKSVVRINVKLGGFEGWCTGTLINNTAQDFKPYILTAEHCGLLGGNFVGPGDLSRWEFYFNYQSFNCSNPSSESQLSFQRITGSELLARSDDNGGDNGSDFALLNLTDTGAFKGLPNPYFAGWDRTNSAPPAGVSIHHPEGDIKKVSTYSRSQSSEFGSSVMDTHWQVWWDATTTNHGVTEPGSSGAPIFNAQGLFKGGLTGGSASCSNNTAPDWYGKFSYHWDQNGSATNRKLQPWLDPLNQGGFVLNGAYRGDSVVPGPIEGDLELAPNPVTDGILRVWNMGIAEIADVYVFDFAGNIVFKKERLTGLPGSLGLPELDLSRLNSGIYIVRIEQDGESDQSFKIRIQK